MSEEVSLEQSLETAVAQLPVDPTPEPSPATPAEPSTPPAAPEVTADTSAEPTPDSPFKGVFDYYKTNYGVDFSAKYKTPEQLLNGALHAMSKVGERDTYAQLGKQLHENPQTVYEHLRQQFSGQSAEPAATPTGGKPEFDPGWAYSLEFDDRGNPTGVKAGEDPAILTKYRAAKAYASKRQNDLLFNEDAVFAPREQKLREELKNELRQEFNETLQATMQGQRAVSQQTNESYAFLNQHPEFFADPKDIGKGLSPQGHEFNLTMHNILNRAIPEIRETLERDTQTLAHMALGEMALKQLSQKPITPPKPISTTATAHRPNASLPPQGHRQIEDGESLLAALQRNLNTQGILGVT